MFDTNSYTKAENIRFMEALDTTIKNESWWKDITTINPSVSLTESYRWLGDLPSVKEWIDTRQIDALENHSYSLTNKHWEDTIGIDVDSYQDNPGYLDMRIPLLADKMARHPNKLVGDLMVDGTTDTCYDGVAFYATTHPVDGDAGTTFSNLMTGSGTSVANLKTDFDQVLNAFLGFKDRAGDPKFDSVEGLIFMYNPKMDSTFREAFKAALASTGGTNIYAGRIQLLPTARLTDTVDWYAHKIDMPIKPFVYQDRQKIQLKWDLTKEFMERKIFFGADARYQVGYTLPELSVKVNNT